MSGRLLKNGAWVLVAAFIAVLGLAISLGFNPPPGVEPIRVFDAVWALSFAGFPITGALVVRRMPERALGWLLCTGPLFLAIALVLSETGAYETGTPGAQSWLGWAANVTFTGALTILVFVPMLLPNGRLPSRGWRVPFRAMVGVAVVWLLVSAFAPGRLAEFPKFSNPAGIGVFAPVFALVRPVAGPAFVITLLASAASPIVRFRRSTGAERQQLKWIAFGGLVVVVCALIVPLMEALFGDLGDLAVTLVMVPANLAFPVSIAIAILRYRLYDIDFIINRALVYGVLTAILAGTYFGLVVAFQGVLAPLTAQSDVAVAASTLAVAGLFGPVRRRVQEFIDRRFYRSRYDAQQTLASFSTRVRDEVELERLTDQLVSVVHDTVHPRHVSLWLTGGTTK